MTIFNEGDELFYKSPDEEVGQLFASADTRVFGSSQKIGNFVADFYNDRNGETAHFVVQVGFGYWRFDKIR